MTENLVEKYGWSSSQALNSGNYITPCILKLLKKLNASRVVDIGAGNGAMCSEMYSLGYDVVGVEYDKEGVDIAKKANPEIPFYQFGIHDDPAELLRIESAFDTVVSTEVVEHLFSPHLLPKYASAVLKENGYLIISTPYHGYLKNMALSIFGAWDVHHTPLWHGGHIKFWSRATLSKLLADNGFKVVSFSGVGRLPYLWKSMVLVAQKV